jgi:hypothetical protein
MTPAIGDEKAFPRLPVNRNSTDDPYGPESTFVLGSPNAGWREPLCIDLFAPHHRLMIAVLVAARFQAPAQSS